MKQQAHVPIVREWLVSLGILTAISVSREEVRMKLGAFLPMLTSDFPDAAFSAESLNHVAKACIRGFPPYPELHLHLSAWWKARRPAPLALPAPPPIRQRDEPTEAERLHVARVAAEAIAALRSSAQPVEDRRPGPRCLTPAQLDQVNPLPGGAKRHASANHSAPSGPDVA